MKTATIFFFLPLALLALQPAIGAPPWSPPITLSKAANFAQSPSVAINDSGAMAAAWARQQGSVYNVQVSINAGGSWTSAVNLSLARQTAIEPSVAIDNTGVATAVWSNYKGRINVIQTSTLVPGGSWSAPVALSGVGSSALSPQVVVDAAGNATAIWVRYDRSGVARLETADRPAGGNWSTPFILVLGAPADFTLIVNAAGDAAAAWSLNTGVYASTRPARGVWSAPSTLALPLYRQNSARIGIAANGDITACWRANTEVRVADKPVGGNWGAATTLYASSALSDAPTLAVTPSGDVMAAWITYFLHGSGANYQISTSVRPAGGTWSASEFLTDTTEHDLGLHAGTTAGGSFVLSWVDSNTDTFQSSTRTTTTPWAPAAVITTGEFGTNLAVAGNSALAIWLGGSFQAMVSTSPVSP